MLLYLDFVVTGAICASRKHFALFGTGADLDTMARGRSFILDFESDEVIRRKLMASGQVDTVIDRQVHRHITDPRLPDIDADGLTGRCYGNVRWQFFCDHYYMK